MLRRSLIIGGLAAAAGRPALAASPLTKGRGGGTTVGGGGGGLSPDGTHMYGASTGGANTSLGAASLNIAAGTLTFGQVGFRQFHSAGGPGWMCEPLLNGTPIAPGCLLGEGNPPWFPELRVANGGNVYGSHLNQIWYELRGYAWAGNPGADYASGPSSSTLPIPAMVYSPPYTISSDGTTVSYSINPTGTVTTAEGVWNFGRSVGSGRALQLNGAEVVWSNRINYIEVDIIAVAGYGQLFYHYTGDGNWYNWACHQPNLTGGGVAPNNVPIPVDIRLTPLHPDVAYGTLRNTFVSAITVTTSNGSTFAGVYNPITGQGNWNLKFSGNNLLINNTDPDHNFHIPLISAHQNNCDITTYFNYETVGAMRAFDFTQKIGMNSNLNAGDTLANIYTDLAYLGIYNIRDSIWGGSSYPQAAVWAPYFAHFAGLGIAARAHFGYQGSNAAPSYPMASWIAELKSNIVTPYPGQVVGVAGPNEPDNAAANGGFKYSDGSGGLTAALAIPAATTAQQALYTAMKADAALKDIPVDEWPSAFSFSGNFADPVGYAARVNMTAFTDRQNLHDYYSADMTNQPTFPVGGPIYNALAAPDPGTSYLRNDAQFCYHGLSTSYLPTDGRFVTTETGWSEPWFTGQPAYISAASPAAKARLTLCNIFDHASLPQCEGVYVYTMRNGQPEYAVLNTDGTPRPAGLAIKNMMAILADTGATRATFIPERLFPYPAYSLSGMPAQSGNTILQKSNGKFYILLWNETPFFNATTGAAIAISSSVTVTLWRAMTGSVYDPINSGTTPISTFTGQTSIVVSLNDAPLIIEAI